MTKADTRTRLMDAAERLVRKNGPDGFSYADLAAEIGIRKASIHYHFPAKADLLTAIMSRYAEAVLDILNTQSASHALACDDLKRFITLYRDAVSSGDSLCLCVAYAVSRDGLAEDTKQAITQFRDAVITWLVACFEKGRQDGSVAAQLNLEVEAAALLATVEGAQIAARISGTLAPFDQAASAFQTKYLN